MKKMFDGSAMLEPGTYVKVTPRRPDAKEPPEPYYAKVVGTDMGRTKYEVGRRFMSWSEWRFLDGGSWPFPSWVAEVSEEEALRLPCLHS